MLFIRYNADKHTEAEILRLEQLIFCFGTIEAKHNPEPEAENYYAYKNIYI